MVLYLYLLHNVVVSLCCRFDFKWMNWLFSLELVLKSRMTSENLFVEKSVQNEMLFI